MKIKLLIFSLLLSVLSWGQSIFTNPITGSNPNTTNPYIIGQTINSNITVSGIRRGSGITGTNANDRYTASGWNSGSLDTNDYFEFTLTPNSGYEIDFVSFVYTAQASGSGPVNFVFKSGVDSFSGNIGSPSVGGTTINLSGAAYQNITGPITFRFYGWGASAAGGTFSINDFTFNGSVTSSCIPPTISTVYPASGPKGTEVTITASAGSLIGATATFGGVAAVPVSSSSTQLVVIVPTGAIAGSLVITNAASCQVVTTFTLIDMVTSSCEGTVINDLIIYEVYDENGGSGGTITLFNGTATSKSLSNYRIFRTSNKNDGNEVNYGALTGTIAPGALAILKVAGSSCGPAATNGAVTGGFNDNDGLQLRASDLITVIDDVDAPNRVGYYMKRDLDAFIPRTSYVAADWTTVDVNPSECISGLGLTTPVVAAAVIPSITAQPTINLTCSSTNAVLTVTATEGFAGGLPLAYQWYVVAPNTSVWSVISGGIYSGENTNALNISSLVGLDGYQYYCQVRENGAACYQATIAVKITQGSSTTWNGTSWSNGTPDLTKLVIINGNFTTSTAGHGNINACSLLVNSPFTATITDGMYFNVQNDVTVSVGATLNIDNNGSLVQINDSGVNTGNINMKRKASVDRYDYVYWSTPVTPFVSSNISPTTTNTIYKWLPTTGGVNGFGNWTNGNETMEVGRGYIERGLNNSPLGSNIDFTATFTGVPNNGVKTMAISRGNYDLVADYSTVVSTTYATKDDDNWNLIGNPYPSSISAEQFLQDNADIAGFVKIWRHGIAPLQSAPDPFYNNYGYNYDSNDYLTYNKTGASAGSVTDYFIGAGQGFFVLMNHAAATPSTVIFNNNMRKETYRNDMFYRTTNNSQNSNNEKGRIWLDISSSSASVRTLVGYVDGATNEKERGYDAITDLKANMNIYSLIEFEGQIIQGRQLPFNENDQVPLGIKVSQNGNYTISIAEVDGFFTNTRQNIYLEDKVTNTIHDLRSSPYSFTANTGIYNNRFVLRYTNQTLGNDDFITIENGVKIYASNNGINMNSELENIVRYEIYNVLGQTLTTKKNVNTNESVESSILKNNQTLIVKVTLENGQIVTKKIIF